MTKEQQEHLIEVRAGEGQPAVMRARPGEEIGPISVGSGGAWRLAAEGVADKHAYLFFDGQHLFLQSVSLDNPARIGGRPVSLDWTQVDAPCEISFGAAKLWFGTYEDEVELGATVDKPIEKKREVMDVASLAEDDDGSADGAVTEIAPLAERMNRGAGYKPPIPAAGGRLYPNPGPAAGMAPSPAAGSRSNMAPGPGAIAPSTRPLASPSSPQTGPPGAIPPPPGFAPQPQPHSHANVSGAYPQANASGAYPQANTSGAYPANTSGAYPQANTPSASPQTMPSAGYPRSTTSGAYPQATASGAYPQSSGQLPQTAVLSSGLNGPGPMSGSPSQAPRTPVPPGTAPFGSPSPAWMAPVITHGPQGFGSAEMMGEGATTPLGMTPRSPGKGVWGSMSFPKKATVILLVPMALSVLVIFADIPGMPGASKRPVATATATTTTAATTRPPEPTPTSPPTAAASVGVTASTVQPNPSVGAKGPIPPATGAAGALASAIPSTVPGGIDAPLADPDDPIAQRAKVLRQDPIATQGARTLQREAADAVAAGAWDRAAKLYEKLAAQHPDQPAFAEAAAITRAKAAADRR